MICSSIILLFSCNKSNTASDIEKLEKRGADITVEERKHLNELYELYALEHVDDSLSPDYLTNAIMYNHQIGNFDHTIKLGNDFLNKYPDHSQLRHVYLSIANANLKLGDYANSIKQYEAAGNIEMLENSYLVSLAKAYLQLSDTDTTSRKPAYLLNAANLKLQTGSLVEADSLYTHFYTTYPKSNYAPLAYMMQVEVKEQLGQLDDARALLSELIDKYPESDHANNARIMLEKDMVGKSAEELYEIATKSR